LAEKVYSKRELDDYKAVTQDQSSHFCNTPVFVETVHQLSPLTMGANDADPCHWAERCTIPWFLERH